MDAYKMVERIKHDKTITDAEWLQIRDEILEFLETDAPDEEKELFYPFGYLEMVGMICAGIEEE